MNIVEVKQEPSHKRQRTEDSPIQIELIEESCRFLSCYTPTHQNLIETTSQFYGEDRSVVIPIRILALDIGAFLLKNLKPNTQLKQSIKVHPCQFILADFIWRKLQKTGDKFDKIVLEARNIESLNFLLGSGVFRESGWCSKNFENKETWHVDKVELSFSVVNQKLIFVFLCDYLTPTGNSIKTN